MTRDAGAEGSGARSGMLLPVVANDFSVASFNAVAGLHTKLSTVVLCCSALDFRELEGIEVGPSVAGVCCCRRDGQQTGRT